MAGAASLPNAWHLAGALLFSTAGGLVPGALFGLVSRLAPMASGRQMSWVVMIACSAVGCFFAVQISPLPRRQSSIA